MKVYLESAEVTLLEKSADNIRDQLLIRLLFHLGCRVSEALAISVDDIDLERGTVTICHLKSRIKVSCPQCGARLGRAHTYCPGCGAKVDQVIAKEQKHRKVRTLPLDSDTLNVIKDYILSGGPVQRDGRLLIFGINRHRAWQIIKCCADRAGLGYLINPATGRSCGVSPHRLRDAFAVHAVKMDDSGDGLRMLQEHLGHTSFNTTARYRKVAGEEHREWYTKLWNKRESGG